MKSIKIGERWLTIQKKKPFKNWLMDNGDFKDFEKGVDMSLKRKTFLRWKHGLSSEESNESIDFTDKSICESFKNYSDEDWVKIDEYTRIYLQMKIVFMQYAEDTWRDIESGKFFNAYYKEPSMRSFQVRREVTEIPEEANAVAGMFGGQVVDTEGV